MTAQVSQALAWQTTERPERKAVRGPWSLAQFGRTTTLWVVAAVVLAVAAVGASTDADPTHGGRWLLIAIVASLLAGAGTTLWLTAGFRAVRGRQQVVTTKIAELGPRLEVLLRVSDAPTSTGSAAEAAGGLVRVPSGTRYHRADCLMVAGKVVEPVGTDSVTLQPCGACQP